jgi:hypothetical protein
MKSTNPQGNKEINQKRGPTTGNVCTGDKRAVFMKEKSTVNSERATLANMITDALGMRGRGQGAKTNPALEGVHSTTNVGRGPTKGNAGKK